MQKFLEWWPVWGPVVLMILGALVAGAREYFKTRSVAKALMVSLERVAVDLAEAGLPREADRVGKTVGAVLEDAGPAIKQASDKIFATVKPGAVKNPVGSPIDLRALINATLPRQPGVQ